VFNSPIKAYYSFTNEPGRCPECRAAKKHKTKAAVAMAIKNAKCSQLFALLAEKIRWFLSNRLVTNLSIASVLYPQHVTSGNSFMVETFLGLSLGGFSLCLGGEYILERGRG